MATSDLESNEQLEPAACPGCSALVDAKDERCRACGMQRPEPGWVALPEDGGPPIGGWDEEEPTRLAALPDEPPLPEQSIDVIPASIAPGGMAPASIVIPPAPSSGDALAALSEEDISDEDSQDYDSYAEDDEDEFTYDSEPIDDPHTNTAAPIRVRVAPQMSVIEDDEDDEDSIAAYSEQLVEASIDAPLTLERGTIYAGRYRVTEQIGEHGNVARFLAIQEPMVRRVVLRVLRPTGLPADRREFVAQRFLRDSQRLARMAHPNLGRVYDFGRGPEGTAFCTTEVMHGLTLREVLNVGPLPMSRLLFVLHHATAGLAAMHENDMVHRNLRASNVVLDMDQRGRDLVRLGGFGLGVLLARAEDPDGELFLAPEIREGNEPTPASDVYALGVLFHKALTGRAPGEEREDGATDQMELPRKLVELVAAMIADDPKDRFSDAGAVLEELGAPPKGFEPDLGDEPEAPKKAAAPPPPPPQPASPWLAIAATALLTAGVSAAGYWYIDSRTPPDVVVQETPAEAPAIDEEAISERVDAAVADALEAFKAEQAELDAQRAAEEEARRAEEEAQRRAEEEARRRAAAARRAKAAPVVVEAEPEPEEPEPEPVVEEPEPVVEEPEPEPVVEEPPPPPPKYPEAPSLSGLWVGKADGGQFALTLSVDGDGRVSGSSARTDGGETISGSVTGAVVPNDGGWSVELTATSSEGAITYSGQLSSGEMKGRMYAGGRNLGRWNARR